MTHALAERLREQLQELDQLRTTSFSEAAALGNIIIKLKGIAAELDRDPPELVKAREHDDVLLARDQLCLAAHTHKYNLRYSDRDTLKELEEAACVYASRAEMARVTKAAAEAKRAR